VNPEAPDVILLGAEWPRRALLRAQLIEEGYDVVAIDSWPIPESYRRAGMKPRVLILDLQGLPRPEEVIDQARLVLPPEQVIVIVALGTVAIEELQRQGYHVVNRPARIKDVVKTTTRLLRELVNANQDDQSTRKWRLQ
jgi:hypothetical protein